MRKGHLAVEHVEVSLTGLWMLSGGENGRRRAGAWNREAVRKDVKSLEQ